MKRIAIASLILAVMLQACNAPGPVASPGDEPSATTEQPVANEPSAMTDQPVVIEAPELGSTRISETDGMTLVFVPAGNFTMGSDSSGFVNESPAHAVSLDSYWIDQTEVTNAMFSTFVDQSGYQTDAERSGSSYVFDPDSGSNGPVQGADWQHPLGPDSSLLNLDAHPVVHVSWNDSLAYCEWAGRRLPTEAEWEKAARGTDSRTFPWGNDFDGTLLNFADLNLGAGRGNSSFDDGFQLTAPVGNYPLGISPYGALDMAGNAWEWVNDWVDEAYYQNPPTSNPGGPASGTYHVIRGGSWYDPEDGQRVTYRGWATPDDTDITLGFRCALSE